MKIIAFFGRKGGSGKSTLSHLTAYGAAFRGVPALVIHTDDREVETHINRPYHYQDGRDEKKLIKLLEYAKSTSDGICIIDGAGNRPKLDAILIKVADLVLIPCGVGGQDAKLALDDLKRLKNSKIILNHWPSKNHPRRKKAEQYINKIPKNKIFARVGDSQGVDRLTEDDESEFQTLPTRINKFARSLYDAIEHNS